jgi:hypothetical protein
MRFRVRCAFDVLSSEREESGPKLSSEFQVSGKGATKRDDM